jgi:Fe-S-cluster containining protein
MPGVWQYMLPPDILAMAPPKERLATCGNCPKIKTDGYRPDYRCCTFHPKISNYLLGLALTSKDASSANITRLCSTGFLIPEGLVATPHRWALSLADLHEDRYGRSDRVLCSFLDASSGLCTIYRYRNASCSTFFCIHDQREVGENFWNALLELAAQCEVALGQWAMDQLGIDVKDYFAKMGDLADAIQSVGDPVNQSWSFESRKILWGKKWFGKELEFFEASGKLIASQKENLWKIANETEVQESEKFDVAAISVIPPQYHEEIDDEDLVGGAITPLNELYQAVIEHYQPLISPG